MTIANESKILEFPDLVSMYTEPSSEFCRESNFDRTAKERCGKDFKFRDKEFTIANEVSFLFLNIEKLL